MAELGTDGVISECNQSSAHFSSLIQEIFALFVSAASVPK